MQGSDLVIIAAYLGHLHHIGKFSKAGNRDHIMVGFLLCAERQRNIEIQGCAALSQVTVTV